MLLLAPTHASVFYQTERDTGSPSVYGPRGTTLIQFDDKACYRTQDEVVKYRCDGDAMSAYFYAPNSGCSGSARIQPNFRNCTYDSGLVDLFHSVYKFRCDIESYFVCGGDKLAKFLFSNYTAYGEGFDCTRRACSATNKQAIIGEYVRFEDTRPLPLTTTASTTTESTTTTTESTTTGEPITTFDTTMPSNSLPTTTVFNLCEVLEDACECGTKPDVATHSCRCAVCQKGNAPRQNTATILLVAVAVILYITGFE